jgi:hypothetical protein
MKMTPSPAQIAGMLEHLRYEITRCLGLPKHDATDAGILDSVYLSIFIHARILATFFECAERREDDVLCSDFGFKPSRIPLSDDDRKRFKKDMMHLTYSRLRHTPESKLWPIEEIILPLQKRCYDFVCHVIANPPAMAEKTELERWVHIKAVIEKGLTRR